MEREETPARNRPAGLSLWPLYAAGFVTAFGAHAVAANLAGYGHGRHVSLIELGGLLAVYDGAEIVLKPIFGSISDRIGAKFLLVAGLIGFAAASGLFVLAGDPALLGLARLAQGSAAAAFSPAASALVAAHGGSRSRGRAFGGYGGAKGLGYLGGPVGGGLLVNAGGYGLLFVMLTAMATGVAVWCALAVGGVAPTQRHRETIAGLAHRLSQFRFVQPVVVLAAATAAFSAGVGFFPVVGRRAGLGPVATGAAVSLLAGCAAVVQPRIGRALDASRLPRRTAGAGLGLCALGLGVGGAFQGPAVLVVAVMLVGIGVGVATPLGFAALAEAAPSGRLGQTMGAGEVGRELGDAGGPLLVGALSPVGLAFGLGGLAVVVGGGALVAARLTQHKQGDDP